MLVIQILLVVFFLFAVVKVVGRYRASELGVGGLVGWLFFWLAAGAVALLPDSTFYFARLVGISRGADLVVYVALALLFYLVFRIMVRQEKIERNLTLVVRDKALEEKVN